MEVLYYHNLQIYTIYYQYQLFFSRYRYIDGDRKYMLRQLDTKTFNSSSMATENIIIITIIYIYTNYIQYMDKRILEKYIDFSTSYQLASNTKMNDETYTSMGTTYERYESAFWQFLGPNNQNNLPQTPRSHNLHHGKPTSTLKICYPRQSELLYPGKKLQAYKLILAKQW